MLIRFRQVVKLLHSGLDLRPNSTPRHPAFAMTVFTFDDVRAFRNCCSSQIGHICSPPFAAESYFMGFYQIVESFSCTPAIQLLG